MDGWMQGKPSRPSQRGICGIQKSFHRQISGAVRSISYAAPRRAHHHEVSLDELMPELEDQVRAETSPAQLASLISVLQGVPVGCHSRPSAAQSSGTRPVAGPPADSVGPQGSCAPHGCFEFVLDRREMIHVTDTTKAVKIPMAGSCATPTRRLCRLQPGPLKLESLRRRCGAVFGARRGSPARARTRRPIPSARAMTGFKRVVPGREPRSSRFGPSLAPVVSVASMNSASQRHPCSAVP